MANQFIDAFTATWNNGATTFNGIKLNVTDSASASDSKLIDLQIGGTSQFNVSKAGVVTSVGALKPSANDGAALGVSGTAWADLFLASGAVINFLAGDVTITHSANLLAFASASGGYTFDTLLTVGHTANLAIGGNADNLEVMGTTAATGGMALGMFNATAGTGAHFDFYRSKNAAIGSATVVASGDNLGSLNWYGAQQTGTFATQTMAAQIRAEVDGTVTSGGSGDMPGRLVFSTTADAGSAVTDRLILDSAGVLKPNANDGVALGTTALGFADLHGATGFTWNIANGDWLATHSSGIMTVTTGDLRMGTAGTNSASVVTVGGTQTLTSKTLTSPVLTTPQINDTSADHQYVFAVSELAADRTVTLPLLTGADTFVFEAHTQTLTNKTLTSAVLNTAVTGSALAAQVNMEAGSATNLLVTPSVMKYDVGNIKAWATWNGASTLAASNNVSGTTDNGAGDTTVTYATGFSAAPCCVASTGGTADSAQNDVICTVFTNATGSARVRTFDQSAGALADVSATSLHVVGDFA